MAGALVNALGAAAATAEAFSDRNTLRHMLRFEAALAKAVADAGLIPKQARSDHRRRLRCLALRSRTARRGRAPHRDADRTGREGADRRSRQTRQGRGRLRALGRHQPGRARHRNGAAARRRAAAAAQGHRDGLSQRSRHTPRSIARRRCSAAPCCSRRRRWRSARRSPAGPPISIVRAGVWPRASRKSRSFSSAARRARCRRWAAKPKR